jgi:uncharacterized delta-60 repeat protein
MRKLMNAGVFAAAALSLVLPGSASAAAGREGGLDLSFGVAGKVTTDFAGVGNADTARAVAVQPDGRIVVAGAAGVREAIGVVDFGLARYLPDGSADPSFGAGGRVTTDLGGSAGINAMVALPGGGFVVAGGAYRDGNPEADFALARYHQNGTLDRTFGTGGLVWTDFGYEDAARALVLQPDGKIVAAGSRISYATDPPVTDWALARYRRDGSPDRSFGTAGRVTVHAEASSGAVALALQPDGKIIAADDRSLIRFDRSGTVDAGFGAEGAVSVYFGDEGYAQVAALAMQGDRLLVAGTFSPWAGTGDAFALARYLPTGQSDSTFGRSGVTITEVGEYAIAHAVLVRGGRVVVAGTAATGGSFDFAMASYGRNGAPDQRFADSGTLTTDFHASYDEINALAWQPDGRVIAAGAAFPARTADFSDFALARYRLT